jgi:predicted kinase
MVAAVVLMVGLPASGKTTTAERLHAHAGGVLIRSCDVYQALGISLPNWVRWTEGFSRDVALYERVRDDAYLEMARRLRSALQSQSKVVVVDAVHGERAKRALMYEVCRTHGAMPTLVWCRCDDPVEVRRRIEARRGREDDAKNEASDLSVFRHISSLWEDPRSDALVQDGGASLLVYDTKGGTVYVAAGAGTPMVDVVNAGLRARASSRRSTEPSEKEDASRGDDPARR